MDKMYHIQLSSEMIGTAKIVILPGDPGRVEAIAKNIGGKEAFELANHREYRSWLVKGIPGLGLENVLVTSTGIGGPSTAIAMDELAKIGIIKFVRVGTTGAIQEHIQVGGVIVTTASVRREGTSKDFAPVEYPAVADYQLVSALVNAAKMSNVPYFTGITACFDTFYPGQERYDSFNRYVLPEMQGSREMWKQLKVLNFEMESATVLTVANVFGLKGACIEGVVVNRALTESVRLEDVEIAEQNTILVIKSALAGLASVV